MAWLTTLNVQSFFYKECFLSFFPSFQISPTQKRQKKHYYILAIHIMYYNLVNQWCCPFEGIVFLNIFKINLLIFKLYTHTVKLLVGALQTLLSLLGIHEILQTFIKIDSERRVRWQSERRPCVNNNLLNPQNITDKKTNTSVTGWDITSAAWNRTWLQCSAIQSEPKAFLTEKWHTTIQTVSPLGHTKGFLPATAVRSPYLHSCYKLLLFFSYIWHSLAQCAKAAVEYSLACT